MITYKWTQRRVAAGLASLAIITLQGCGGADTAMVDATGQTEITTPALLRTVAALDGDNLTLDVAVNDQVTVLTQTEPNLWTGTVNVPANRSSDVVVSWGQNYGTFGYLPLARQQKSVVVGADPGVVVFENGYNTAFDFDNDGMSNLVELEEGRSPVSFLDVTINVDGAFPTGLSLPGSNVCGARMPIAVVVEQLVTDAVVTPDDNIAWWCGLYLPESRNVLNEVTRLESIVLIVKVTDDILFVDSPTGQEYRDDSVEVFIDGDNSKRSSYDGANDFHFRFLPEGTGGVFLTRGPYLPENLTASVDYFTGGYQLTVTIPVQEVGIDNGQPFGLNIEVNDDDDGGGRDAKYSWVAAEGRDISWRNPSAFGTSQIP
ncbi:hypothetical protein AB833_04675 [Chromatiales bacterium (ex Bugula neritina AB1)]|nr:hypothetical protein AB833_04675 [Chromatiales bacterium (ex Bugula neritina AB1)]